MTKLPYKNSSFDIVTASLSVDYIKDLIPVFKEISRVLKKGGVFYYSNESPIASARERYEDKTNIAAPEQIREIERILYLQILDNAWREHLYSMDTLKTGIGLRSYNQKDPLVEYKKESYNLFIELVQRIKIEAMKTLQISELQDRDEEERIKEMLAQAEAQMRDDMVEGHELKQPVKVEKKIARNEPCPCGSGKKYKQCCGKSGPKKGALAQ
jgi:preprotein translocase subunit SecA